MGRSCPVVRPVVRPVPGSKEYLEWLSRARIEYYQLLAKSDNFKSCGMSPPSGCRGLRLQNCNERSPCPGLVVLYARLGLHRYNMLQGKNLELSHVKKFNRSTNSLANSFYITLEAKDPDSDSLQTFQTLVDEQNYRLLRLTCTIARPLGQTNIGVLKRCTTSDTSHKTPPKMPELPPGLNPFKRFYVLKKSELQDNDWIRLYLELAVATTNRTYDDHRHDLSNLKILKVAIETTQDLEKPHEGLLRAPDATLYIRFKDSCEGKVVDRIALVRRLLQEEMFILGSIHSSDTIIPKRKSKLLFRRLLSVHKPWRLSSPRRRKAYENRRRLHKTRSM